MKQVCRYVIGSVLCLLMSATVALGRVPPDLRQPVDAHANLGMRHVAPPFHGFAVNDLDGDGVADHIIVDTKSVRGLESLERIHVQSSAKPGATLVLGGRYT